MIKQSMIEEISDFSGKIIKPEQNFYEYSFGVYSDSEVTIYLNEEDNNLLQTEEGIRKALQMIKTRIIKSNYYKMLNNEEKQLLLDKFNYIEKQCNLEGKTIQSVMLFLEDFPTGEFFRKMIKILQIEYNESL